MIEQRLVDTTLPDSAKGKTRAGFFTSSRRMMILWTKNSAVSALSALSHLDYSLVAVTYSALNAFDFGVILLVKLWM